MRLQEIQRVYGDRVRVHWRTFPLIPDHRPGRRATLQTRDGRQRVAAEEPRARFRPPDVDLALPASSLPALTAAKCAERQGPAVFERLHDRLFVAHFHDNLDISRQDVLWTLARQCELDMTRFQEDYVGDGYQAALHDYAEGAAWFGVSALPTVVFNEKLSLVGAVPTERYRSLLDWVLAGEPGGVIPLAPIPPGAEVPGQSTVAGADATS